MMHHVKIEPLGENTRTMSIVVDGREMNRSLTGFTIRAESPAHRVEVTLDGLVDQIEYEGDVLLRISSETYRLLTESGWTPPNKPEKVDDRSCADGESA